MFTRVDKIKSCYIGPAISPEQFIAEHFFLYLIKGNIQGYDGNKRYNLAPGESCIVRKNHLARYNKQKEANQFEKVVVIFDEVFLRKFKDKHQPKLTGFSSENVFLKPKKSGFIADFLKTISPYYQSGGKIDVDHSDLRREELLNVILKSNPRYADIFFDFGIPGKIDLEAFMNKNYKFNVSNNRLAFLTGRSISAFKRDFKKIFNDTPGHWLLQKRLREAHFLIENKKHKPSEIYLDLGFEDLSHFSFAFKNRFGYNASSLST
ncbi:helix-turn-helix domain-containing protein [Pedobacter roseus]|uniref:Helix-turn-helix transcriptional regulator n=1 Tax=Pedobacter roseus TaxID=336820 RepID=A0A7G9QAS2_9SPHI|nr:AraC family transcriptional regulator [Pedobacter roseus]QNN40447.1 helix-turn-helix transcriptional regulator [Pedobacter roseus]